MSEDKQQEDLPRPVSVGAHVEVELMDRSGELERVVFDVVPDKAADFSRGLLGEGTPLAKAILGKLPGSVVPYPVGDMQQVRILTVAPGAAVSPNEAAERRQAALEKTIKELNRTSAALFASSYSSKWGDYDPEGVEHWEE